MGVGVFVGEETEPRVAPWQRLAGGRPTAHNTSAVGTAHQTPGPGARHALRASRAWARGWAARGRAGAHGSQNRVRTRPGPRGSGEYLQLGLVEHERHEHPHFHVLVAHEEGPAREEGGLDAHVHEERGDGHVVHRLGNLRRGRGPGGQGGGTGSGALERGGCDLIKKQTNANQR